MPRLAKNQPISRDRAMPCLYPLKNLAGKPARFFYDLFTRYG
jgi:hypothetical protein